MLPYAIENVEPSKRHAPSETPRESQVLTHLSCTSRFLRKFPRYAPLIEDENVAVNKLDGAESQLLSMVLSDMEIANELAEAITPEPVQVSASPQATLLAKTLNEINENL
jgi:hypothetical protein